MRHRRALPRTASALLAAALLVASGCGNPELDDARVVETVRAQLQGQGVRADDLECPDVPAQVGSTARCTFSVDGQPVDAVATVSAVDAGSVTYVVRTEARPVPRQLLERVVVEKLAQAGAPVGSARCTGDLPARAGATVTCTLDGAGDWTVRTTSVDGGRVEYSLEQVGLR